MIFKSGVFTLASFVYRFTALRRHNKIIISSLDRLFDTFFLLLDSKSSLNNIST